VDRSEKAALALWQAGCGLAKAAKQTGLGRKRLAGLIDSLLTPPAPPTPAAPASGEELDRRLQRLVLHVSNDCNLRCAYCYAAGGSYGRARRVMSPRTAIAAIDWTSAVFGGVKSVQFFGGEPLLNPRLIFQTCEYFQALHAAGRLRTLPRFALVTNGTLGDDRALEMLRLYGISPTISIDGPQEVHDALRGKGSFAKADAFARRCLETEGVRVDFECTWTPVHVRLGVSVSDAVHFFRDRYGHPVLHVVAVSAPGGHPLHLDPQVRQAAFRTAARDSVRSLIRGKFCANSFTFRVLEALRDKRPILYYCPAGSATLAVAADGGLYPCFMFAGDARFRVGRFSGGKLTGWRAPKVAGLLEACRKDAVGDCRDCWAAPLCSGCIGGDQLETGSTAGRPACDVIRGIAETTILEVARARIQLQKKVPHIPHHGNSSGQPSD
jgi:uncharacterized protein